MNNRFLVFVFIAIALMASGCSLIDQQQAPDIQACSNEWYTLVETKIATGDAYGHGPDLGSLEWRSVVEFKLGIRGQRSVPQLDSEQWCNYIDDAVFKNQ